MRVKMLETRLKAVYYYNTPIPNVEICGSQQVADLVRRSIAEFPNAESDDRTRAAETDFPSVGRYQQVSVDDFLAKLWRVVSTGIDGRRSRDGTLSPSGSGVL